MAQLTPSTFTGKYPPVLSKIDFVRRYRLGEFGNCSPTWDSYDDWAANGFQSTTPGQLYHIRNRVAGGPTFYNVPESELSFRWHDLVFRGTKPETLYISAMAPHDRGTIQGELMQSERGSLYLLYTRGKKPMRDALAESSHEARGIVALTLLKHYLCPKSYDWLQVLLSRYPEHVIEFSCFSVEFGTLPGFNTCFWECRLY